MCAIKCIRKTERKTRDKKWSITSAIANKIE